MFPARLGSLLFVAAVVVLLGITVASVSAGKSRNRAANCPPIKLKRQWGGKPSLGLHYQVRPIRFVVIHHTVTSECSGLLKCAEILQNMQSYHQNELDYNDISYK